MKKLLKEILTTVTLTISSTIITMMSLDILLGMELLTGNAKVAAVEKKIVSVAKSVKNKIW